MYIWGRFEPEEFRFSCCSSTFLDKTMNGSRSNICLAFLHVVFCVKNWINMYFLNVFTGVYRCEQRPTSWHFLTMDYVLLKRFLSRDIMFYSVPCMSFIIVYLCLLGRLMVHCHGLWSNRQNLFPISWANGYTFHLISSSVAICTWLWLSIGMQWFSNCGTCTTSGTLAPSIGTSGMEILWL